MKPFKFLKIRYKPSKLGSFFINFYAYRLTGIGKYLLILGFLSPLASIFAISSTPIAWILMSFAALSVIVARLLSWAFLPRMEVEISTPCRASADSIVSERISVSNKSRRNGYTVYFRENMPPENVICRENQGYVVPFIKKGERLNFNLNLYFKKRGEYALKPLRVESPFPLGVIKNGYSCKKERHILVYPNFKPLLSLNISAGKKLQPGGISLASRIGESTEFLGTREFREGDDPRFIHWKSWARLNQPIIKEFQEEYFSRIALFIDSYIPPKAGDEHFDNFEALLSLAASISDYLQKQEYIVDIIAAGPEIYYLQAGRSLAYLDQILDILACLNACRVKPYNSVESRLMEELSRVSTVIVLLLGWDEERRDFLLRIREMGANLKVFLVSEKINPEEISSVEDILGDVTVLNNKDVRMGVENL